VPDDRFLAVGQVRLANKSLAVRKSRALAPSKKAPRHMDHFHVDLLKDAPNEEKYFTESYKKRPK